MEPSLKPLFFTGLPGQIQTGDATFAMRKRIADMIWHARQRQIGAVLIAIAAIFLVLPTFSVAEHDASLPPVDSDWIQVPDEAPHRVELLTATQQARNTGGALEFGGFNGSATRLDPAEQDMVRYIQAQIARGNGDPRKVAAELAAMQKHWASANRSDATVMRGLVEFVRANDLTMPLRQAEKLAANALPRARTFIRDAKPTLGETTALIAAAGLALAALAILIAGTRMARIANLYQARVKQLG
ncbi:hypothetical protein [Novosphingobium sp. B 225]|uniref:hypothetical protein n=1 Tax=Novosphingobium sp. B 225 TaxID=1961849 RepID=UPI000B4A7A06|nr:hypothetical protein [Novosphingobium sp. B 225]